MINLIKTNSPQAVSYEKNVVGKAFDDLKYIGRSIVYKDRGYAFRQAVELAKNTMLNGVSDEVYKLVSPKISVVTRCIQTVLDTQLALQTWKNPEASVLDKIIDTGHVITDICGIAGIFLPGMPLLSAIAYLGDVGAVGYHLIGMFDNQGGGGYPMAGRSKKTNSPIPAQITNQNNAVDQQKPETAVINKL